VVGDDRGCPHARTSKSRFETNPHVPHRVPVVVEHHAPRTSTPRQVVVRHVVGDDERLVDHAVPPAPVDGRVGARPPAHRPPPIAARPASSRPPSRVRVRGIGGTGRKRRWSVACSSTSTGVDVACRRARRSGPTRRGRGRRRRTPRS
jgi:hypothetical protein